MPPGSDETLADLRDNLIAGKLTRATIGIARKDGSTFQAACEIVGVYARDWNIYAVSAQRTGTLDLNQSSDADVAQLTTNGASNKEPAWFWPKGPE